MVEKIIPSRSQKGEKGKLVIINSVGKLIHHEHLSKISWWGKLVCRAKWRRCRRGWPRVTREQVFGAAADLQWTPKFTHHCLVTGANVWKPVRRISLSRELWLIKRCDASKINFEIIVIDDASPDGTLDVAKKLQGLYGDRKIVKLNPSPHDHSLFMITFHCCIGASSKGGKAWSRNGICSWNQACHGQFRHYHGCRHVPSRKHFEYMRIVHCVKRGVVWYIAQVYSRIHQETSRTWLRYCHGHAIHWWRRCSWLGSPSKINEVDGHGVQHAIHRYSQGSF